MELGFIPVRGAIENEFRIMVDGKLGGTGKFTLIKRNNKRMNFHATCDAISQDLQATGCLFFDSQGRPRLKSLKEAMMADNKNIKISSTSTATSTSGSTTTNHPDYFLYLDTFQLNPEHRHNATWIGAKALRSLLHDDESVLQNKWSVAIYVGDSKANFSEQDVKRAAIREEHLFCMMSGEEWDEEDLQEENEWKEHLQSLAKQDLRPFIRCGFQQAVDSVRNSNCLYAFAVPSFLTNHRPMLSHQEALAVNIAGKKDMSTGSSDEIMSATDSKLLRLMKSSCAKRKDLCEKIRQLQAASPPTRELLDVAFDRVMDEQFRLISENEQTVQHEKEILRSTMEQQEDMKSQYAQMKSMARQLGETDRYHQIQSMLAEVEAKISIQSTRSSMLKEKISENEERVAKTKESFESIRSRREVCVEEEFQRGISTHTEALATARTTLSRHDSEVKAEVANMVGRNNDRASVKNSNAIHACAANMIPEYIDMMLEFLPEGEWRSVLNKHDSNGLTPLMAAVIATTTSPNFNSRFHMAEKLMDLGADKNITDASGETALGKFRGMKRSMADFRNTFGLQRQSADTDLENREHARLEQLLRPFGGPTTADDAYLDDNSHNNDAADDDADDDDGDDVDDDDDDSEIESDGDEDQVDDEKE